MNSENLDGGVRVCVRVRDVKTVYGVHTLLPVSVSGCYKKTF